MSSSRPSSNPAGSRPPPHDHTPSTPSGLRQSRTLSSSTMGEDAPGVAAGPSTPQAPSPDEIHEHTSLLHHERAHDGPCDHGTFSPRVMSPAPRGISFDAESTSMADSDTSLLSSETQAKASWRKTFSKKVRSRKMTESGTIARQHGVKDSWSMYLSYYVPSLIWIKQYRWSWLRGDLTAALTIASMYLPMALSLADNLAHVPPINGLYAFAIQPLIYALLGSCPLMIVGPEAAGSLLIGSIVKSRVDLVHEKDDAMLEAEVAGIAVGISSVTVLLMGIFRLGFLDSVLSRPFLRGFISAIGVVIFIDQLTPVLGLVQASKGVPGLSHGSTVQKLQFALTHLGERHHLTALVGVVSFVVIMVLREIKRRLQPRYSWVAHFPDRVLVVVGSALLAWHLDWEHHGVHVLGKIEAASGHIFTIRNPFKLSNMPQIREAMDTSFLIAMLGFFESSVAAKSLGGEESIEGMQLSPNRELVALGASNLVGSFFMAIPSFGGYGRSKVSRSAGGKSPMTSLLLSLITVICILYLLPWFYYLPKPVLSALIMAVAWSLIEEAPHDIRFFLRIQGWTELYLMAVILAVTIFFSLNLGIAIGIGLSLLQVVRHSTRPRIQILGRIPNSDHFANAEEHPENLEFVEGCLIVKIPEPLTFANTGELKNRLRRLELYGTGKAHPALPRLRPQTSNRNVIFDIHGVTSMDGSGTQVLEEIVRNYRDRGVRVFFSRPVSRENKVWELMERSGIVELVGGSHRFVDDVKDALRMTEVEEYEELGACAAASDNLS
ncbi:sulfate transporter family-domain-containing protein [Durotheca rogersii]|uniref:sulfate transporter family-domain-containing protein n=1 Tax=Durotheca rogersii TaxID=419775 RepID=UPI00221FEC82|nr:sulfate transporter family-domain-containing protein [Durotheca rogersii]KAI5856727.1 sulfate transporter family-domain-containing protein [Durotheca rogersii]